MKLKPWLILLFLSLGSIYSRSQTLPPAPDLTGNCTGALLPYTSSGDTANIIVGGQPVTVSFSAYADVIPYPSSSIPTYCGNSISIPNAFILGFNNTPSGMKIRFNKRVSNVLVTITSAFAGESCTFTVKDGCDTVHPAITMSAGGDCNNNWAIDASTSTVTSVIDHAPAINIGGGFILQNPPNDISVNLGGVWFDEITISKPAAPPPGNWGHWGFSFCVSASTLVPGPPPPSSTAVLNLCSNQLPATWNGITIPVGSTSNPAFTTYTATSVSGCDSTVTLNLMVSPVSASTTTLTLCPNQLPAAWNGITLPAGATSNPAFTTYTTTNATGCDSIVTLNLTIIPSTTSVASITLCANQLPASWNGITIPAGSTSNPAFSTYTTTNAAGCDSTVTLNLTVNANVTSTASLSLCSSQLPASWNGITIPAGTTSNPAFATYTTTSVAGCDSTVTLNVTVNPNITSTASLSLCAGQLPASWNGIAIPDGTTSDPAFTTYTTTSAAGCDSTVTLNLSVTQNVTSTASLSLCVSQLPASWNGINIPAGTVSNPAFSTYTTTNAAGCDSVVTLNLTVTENVTSTAFLNVCANELPTNWNGIAIPAGATSNSAFTTYTTTNTAGCDSTVTLDLTVTPTETSTETATICEGQSYTLGTQTLTASGTYTETFTTASTCDSIVTLILTVSALPIINLQQKETEHYCLGDTVTLTASGADIYQWWWRGAGKSSLGGGITKAVPIYTNNQLVVVEGSNNYGCTDTAEIMIKAQSCCQLLVPNAFSPNGDGLNDGFGPETDGNPRGYAMQIYNRWGQMIYVSYRIGEKWNGTYKGQPASSDTYYYLITGECAGGEQINMKGDFLLLR